ncbi:hypothetical protein D3C73_244850 [compost metagenome]
MFDGVDDVIAGYRAYTQAWQIGIHSDNTAAMPGIAVTVGHKGTDGQAAVTQCDQIDRWHIQTPAQVCIDLGGIGYAAQHHGNGITFGRTVHTAAQRLATGNLCRVQHVIAGHRLDTDGWNGAVDLNLMVRAYAITHPVHRLGGHGMMVLRQLGHVHGRHLQAPLAADHFCGVILAIQTDGHGGAVGQVATTAQQQIAAFLYGVDHIVLRQDVYAQLWRGGVDDNVMGGTAAVARLVGQAGRQCHAAVRQRVNHAGRYADTPVARLVYRGGIALARHGQRQDVPGGCAMTATADDLRLAMLGRIDDVVARHGINGNNRHGGIH